MCVYCMPQMQCTRPAVRVQVQGLNFKLVQEINLEIKQQGTRVLKRLFGRQYKVLVTDDVLGNMEQAQKPEGC